MTTPEPIEAVVERVLGEHRYLPSAARGVSRCSCGNGENFHGMKPEHDTHVAAQVSAAIGTQRGEGGGLTDARVVLRKNEQDALYHFYALADPMNFNGDDGLVATVERILADRLAVLRDLHRGSHACVNEKGTASMYPASGPCPTLTALATRADDRRGDGLEAVRALLADFDTWTPYDSRDTGRTYLADSVEELVADIRAALLDAQGSSDPETAPATDC